MDERYQRAKMYTIRCYDDNSKIYVGSTIETLTNRMGKHRADSKKEGKKNRILYQNVNSNWSNWYIELYENYPCNNLYELLKKEGQIIREIGTLNKNMSGRTEKEYREDNKERVEEYYKQYYKEYYEKNIDKKIDYAKEYRDKKIVEQQKEWRENNKEKKKQIDKKYNEDNNKEKIAEQKNIYIAAKK